MGLVLDAVMPTWDATRREHRVIDAPIDDVYAAALDTDFLDAVRRSRLVRALFRVRAAFECAARRARRTEPEHAGEPPHLLLSELSDHGQWVGLGTDPPREIAFGAIGRFWAGETRWKGIDARDFTTFWLAGFAKIACNLSFREYGDGRTLVSYEARTYATDDDSRRAFLRYWRFVAPFVGAVMRATLRVVDEDVATRRQHQLAHEFRARAG
jgi:hypothetical protein